MNWRAFSTVFIVVGGLTAVLAGWKWDKVASSNRAATEFNTQLTGLARDYGVPQQSTTVWMVLAIVGAVMFVVGVAVFVSFRRHADA